jgi:outer membrane protein assembly factor BamB
VAYGFDGRERWRKPLPMVKTFRNQGSATSPILVGDRLLLDVHLEKESYLLAVRTKDGETAWQTKKPEWNGGWSSPITWKEGGETLVGVLNPGRFTAHSLRDGSERWWIGDLPRQTCATPVVGDGVLYLAATGTQGGRENITLPPSFDEMLARYDQDKNGLVEVEEIPEGLLLTDRGASKGEGNMTVRRLLGLFAAPDKPQPKSYDRDQWSAILKGTTEFVEGPWMKSGITAVRVGGKGDAAGSHVQWSEGRGVPEVPSPLLYKDRLYLVRNGGLVVSREAATGKLVFEGRLGAQGGYYASPIAADGRIYAASDEGTIAVFEAGDRLNVMARNELGEPILATPAIVDGRLYVRTVSSLYAFGR